MWTRLEYDRLIEAELFGPDWLVRVQMALALDDESEPEPDISVVPADPDDYEAGHPTTDNRLEVFRDPVASSEAAFGWRDARGVTLGRTEHVTPLALPSASIAVASVLSRIRTP